MQFFALARIARQVIQSEGYIHLLRRIYNRLKRQRTPGITPSIRDIFKKNDVIDAYRFVLTEDHGTEPLQGSSKSINWLIPDFGIGSGGHLNIFRYIQMLEKRGYQNTICLVGSHRHSSPEHAKELIKKHFFHIQANVVFDAENLPPARYSFATSWITAYALRGFSKTSYKLYFVQDFEPSFYAKGSEYEFAEDTYRFGFTGVCAGDWLADMLATKYSMPTHSLGFSYDNGLYRILPRREPNIRRVFCYCRPPTIRRGLETAMLALDLVGRTLPDVKFVFAGWDMSNIHFPHEHLNAGILSLQELPDLYNQCDAALVISFTNLSLLPLELMACGCLVVSNSGDNVEWLLNKENSFLAGTSPNSIANSVIQALENEEMRTSIKNNAMNFALSTNWENECDNLNLILEGL